MKKTVSLFLALVLLLMLAACGKSEMSSSSSSVSYDAANSEKWDYGEEWSAPGEYYDEYEYDQTAETAEMSARKLIYNATVQAETKDFDTAKLTVDAMISQYGGYLENSEIDGSYRDNDRSRRHLRYVIRVPAERLTDFLDAIEAEVNVTSRSVGSDDVTTSYVDTAARLSSLEKEEKRLLELLDEAEDLNEVLQIEDRLSTVRYQIESMTSIIRTYDSEIAYSKVTFILQDVTEYTVKSTFGSRIGSAFVEGWQDFLSFGENLLVLVIEALPFLILLGGITLLIILLVRRSNRRRREKYAAMHPVPVQAPQPPVPQSPASPVESVQAPSAGPDRPAPPAPPQS